MHPIAVERLHDALRAAHLIREAVGDQSFDQYKANDWFRAATERQLEIIGEALNQARRSAPQDSEQIPGIGEWIALRNVLSHAYFRVNHSLVWTTITKELPGLIATLERMLAEQEIGDQR